MAGQTLDEMRTNVRLILGATDEVVLPAVNIDRAVRQAVAVLSRFFPRERIAELTFRLTITNETWISGAAHGVYVKLANKPVRYGSEIIKNNGLTVTYARDVDYTIDYSNGLLTTISGGSMAANTTYKVTYDRDQIVLDIDTILTKPIGIARIETRQADEVPQVIDAHEEWGTLLTIITDGSYGQLRVADKTHIVIYYWSLHDEPTAGAGQVLGAAGSYPQFLDEVILIGASGYLMLEEGIQNELLAIADLASSRVALTNADDDNALMTTALANIKVANDKISAEIVLADAQSALAATALGKIAASGTLADTALAKVTTEITLADTAIALIPAVLTLGATALGKVATYADPNSTARTVEWYLDTGDAILNTVPAGGPQAALQYVQFAQAELGKIQAYINEAMGRYAHGQALVAEASASYAAAQHYIEEGHGRMEVADGFIKEAHERISSAQAYLAAAAGYFQQAQGYALEVHTYLARADMWFKQSELYQVNARELNELAKQQKAEGELRLGEFMSTLRDRAQIATHLTHNSPKQYADYARLPQYPQ